MKSRQWSNFLKSLYFNLLPSALLFILVVLLISTWIQCCSSSLFYIYVFACLMQTLSFSLSEIKKTILNNFRPVSGVSVFLNFKTCMTHLWADSYLLLSHKTTSSFMFYKPQLCVCVCVLLCQATLTSIWLICQEQVEWVYVCVCEQRGEATVEAGNIHDRCALHMWSHDAYKAD